MSGNEQRDVLLTGAICTVPWEVLKTAGYQLVIGVYGTNAEGTLVIPTVYAMCGGIASGADPRGDESVEPTQTLVEQIMAAAGTAVETANAVKAAADAGDFKGDKGDTGPQGPAGPKGDKGDAGSLGSVTATVSNDTGTPKVQVTYDGENANFAFSGIKGERGEKGDTGEKGETGATGAQGVQGPTGPQGPKGDTGEQGPKGDKGDKGDPGNTPDMTAYRTAEAQDAIDAGKQNTLIQSGAAVGQIAKITAVDDNGKPTAWQAVDMPSGGGDVWEFGGTIPLDLATPTAIYEFAPCSIWKKVRIVRVRSSYNAALKSNVWYGASNCKHYGGGIGQQDLLYTSNGYVYHYIEMMSDDDGGIIGTYTSSNNTNLPSQLQISCYSNNRVASNIPATYGSRSLTKDSNWMVKAVDPSEAWDGNETYYWWGVRV